MSAEAPTVTIQPDEDKKTHKQRLSVLGSSVGVTALSTLAALAGCGGSSGNTTATSSANKAPSGTGKPEAGRLHVEITDNHLGTQLFSSPEGAAVADGVPGEIQYGAHVLVRCYVPNESGMSSINDFYLIAKGVDGDGHLKGIEGTYAPADTFANGGPMGPNPDTIDPRVPQC